MYPKVDEPKTVFGIPNCTLFIRLNASRAELKSEALVNGKTPLAAKGSSWKPTGPPQAGQKNVVRRPNSKARGLYGTRLDPDMPAPGPHRPGDCVHPPDCKEVFPAPARRMDVSPK